MNNLLSVLQSILDKANQAKTKKEFFSLLYEFATYIMQDPRLHKILTPLFDEGKRYHDELNEVEKNALSEVGTIAKKMEKYVIKNEEIVHGLTIYKEKYKKNKTDSYALANILLFTLNDLANDESVNHTQFLKDIGKIRQIGDYKFIRTGDAFPITLKALHKGAHFMRKQETAAWHSLGVIIYFFRLYDFEYYDGMIEYGELNGLDISLLRHHHSLLMRYTAFENEKLNTFPPIDTIDKYSKFPAVDAYNTFASIDEYREHMWRLLNYIKSPLPASTENRFQDFDIYYNDDKHTLTINHIPISFDDALLEYKLLSALTLNGRPCIEPISLDKIIEQVFDENDSRRSLDDKKPARDALNSARKRINKRINKRMNNKGFRDKIWLACPTDIKQLMNIKRSSTWMSWNPEYKYVTSYLNDKLIS